MADEKPCKNLAIQQTTNIEDVTAKVFRDVKEDMSPTDRAAALQKGAEAVLAEARDAGFRPRSP